MNLGTRRWKRLRLAILVRDDFTCRVLIDARTGWPSDAGDAVECGRTLDTSVPVGKPSYPVVDHVIDRADGGSDEPSNLRASCWLCNGRRAAARTNLDRRRAVHTTRAL